MDTTGPDLEALFAAVAQRLVDHVDALASSPAHDPVDGRALAARLSGPPPDQPRPLPAVLDQLFDEIVPAGVNPASPGSLSYVNGGGLVHAALGGLIASVTNRFGGFFEAGPGVSAVEAALVRWMADLVGMPDTAGGLLLTGGSMANLTAIVAAREDRVHGPLDRAVLYTSDQAHHSVQKAAFVAGIPRDNVRVVPSDDRFRMRLDALAEQLDQDRAEGLRPFCLVGTAGTTATGAIDDLPALAAIAGREGLWFHVDAAYAGFFCLTARGRRALAGIERADSVTLDPHKSLFLPFGTGALVVRDLGALERAHTLHSACVIGVAQDATGVNFADLSVEQTREARGLKLWLPLQLLGVDAFRQALDDKLDLARHAAAELARIPGVELVSTPELSTFAFAVRGPADRAQRLVDAINARGAVHLATAPIGGRTVVRVCVISFRTRAEHISTLVQHVREAMNASPAAEEPA